MGSLTSCIRKAGKALDKKDADAIKSLRDDLKADGVEPQEAAIEAATMHMRDLKWQRTLLAENLKSWQHELNLPNFDQYHTETPLDARKKRPKKQAAPEAESGQVDLVAAAPPTVIPDAVIEEATRGYQNQSAYTFTDADMDSYRAGLRGEPKPEPADPELAFELDIMYEDAIAHRVEILGDPDLQIEGGAEEKARILAERDAEEDRDYAEELAQQRLDDDAALEAAETKRAEDVEWSALLSEEDNFFARERENDIIIKQNMAKNAVYDAQLKADAALRDKERAAYRAERYDGSPLGKARQRIDPWMSHVHSHALKYRLPFSTKKRMDHEGVKAFAPKTLKAIGQKVGGKTDEQLVRLKSFQHGVQMAAEKAHYGIVLNPMSDEGLYDTAVSLHKGRGVDKILPEDADGNLARILSSVQVGITAEEFKLYGEADAEAATQRQAEHVEAEETAAPKKSLKTAQAKRKKTYGKKNTVFTESAADKARAAIKAKLGTLNSGIDPELMQAGVTLAGYHIEAGARKFTDFATAMIEDLGDGITPYLRSFYESVRYYPGFDAAEMSDAAETDQAYTEIQEAQDAERTAGNEESDSQHGSDEVRGTGSDLSDAGRGGSRRETTRSGQEASGTEQGSGDAVDLFSAPVAGERSDNNFHNEKSSLEGSAARDPDKKGSSPGSTGGLFAERETGETTEEVIPQAPAVIPAARVTGKINSGDLSQVKQQMPFLTDGQAEDVVFAENRLAKPEGLGVLFTNGTGTGKTFTGLGVVKRMVAQGKKNILIAAPKQPIVDAWVKAGRDFFDLTLTPLKDTKDAGTGIAITTFANLGDNPSLMSREWDAFVMDEAHYLASSSTGKTTKHQEMLRAMAMTRNTARDRIEAIHSDLVVERNSLLKEAKSLRASDDERSWHKEPAVQARADELTSQINDLTDAERERMEGVKPEDKPRSIFLSATPFAYEKTVQWANEFLFDWGYDKPKDGQKGQVYNSGDHYETFMMTHFGYRMRYNKLTEPDAKVDRGLMQRAFNTWLKKEGALSGRALDSNFDYDRKFVMTESALGKQVDDALDWLRNNEDDSDEMVNGKRELDGLLKDSFGYHQRMYFLEAMKASEAIPHIQAHLDKGRKVVVMHDFKKGGTMNPFILAPSSDEGKMAYGALQEAFPRLIQAFSYLPSPIETLSKEFPGTLVYNGNFSAKKRVIMQNEFNSDAADSPQLIIAQGDAMREGVSIHDTTGKFQRVMVHLGMPVKPTAAIQQEGRIYRTGQASDTMFRYFTIGTNWERYAFASKIAGRASAAENLAMGEQARGLKEAFINAYEEADNYEPGFDGEGQGGKETDKALASSLTPWDIAKSYYFGSKKQGSGRSARGREHSEFFATPEPLGMKMVQWANIRGGETALEPSAGHGAIGRFFPENSTNRAIEYTDELSSKLALHFDGDVQTGDFMDHNVVNKYDAIVMNPPFGQGGKQAADHVRKAMKHLRDGGRIVALIPTGPAADKQFDKLLDSDDAKHIYTAAEIMLPSVTFERAGTKIRTRVLVLEKATDPAQAAKIQQSNRDYTDADSIANFFDRLENSEIKDRVKPEVEEDEAPQKGSRDTKLPGSESPAELSKPVQGAGFTTMEATHTKTDAPLYVVNMSGSMGDSYTEINSIAKQNGGFYIRARMRNYYKPNDGGKADGVPTFSFASPIGREKFLAAVKPDGLGEGSARAAKPKGKVTAAQVEQAIAKLRKGWKAGPDITVVQSVEELPNNITGEMRKQGIDAIAGWWDRNNKHVYLVADSLHSKRDAQVTLLHEAVGHYGIETIMGKAGINQFLRYVQEARETDSKVSEAYDHVNRLYPRASAPQKAAEVVARIAESNPGHNLVQRLFQLIRQLLRKAGFNVPFNNNDITEALRRAGKNMETGEYKHGGGKGGLFQAAYHGSPHRHKKFSMDKIGSGEGFQAYGHGLYFAQKREIAEYYREALSQADEKQMEYLWEKMPVSVKGGEIRNIFHAMWFESKSPEDAVQAAMRDKGYSQDDVTAAIKAAEGAAKLADGQLYTVDVPENHELLDWDAPLSQQPGNVGSILDGDPIFEGMPASATGEQYYNRLAEDMGGQAAASEHLKNLGVPGLRYFDGESQYAGNRTKYKGRDIKINRETDPEYIAAAYIHQYGKNKAQAMMEYDNHADAIDWIKGVDESQIEQGGSRNFVIFDEDRIKITDKLFRAVDESPDSRESMNRRMREEHHGIWYKAKNYAKRQLTPGGLLPRAVFDAKITRDSDLGAIEMDVQSHVWALENAFKRDFGKSYDRRTKAQDKLMKESLAGRPSDDLPDATLVALESMRQYIDAQSGQYIEILKQDALNMMVDMEPARRQELIQMLQDGVFDGLNKKEAAIVQKMLLLQTMMSNVGEYVNRSYRAFDDKQWVRDVPDDVLNNARGYLESRYLEENAMDTEADAAKAAHRVMESILKEDTAFDSMEAFIKESKLGAKDLSILKRRKQIAPEIRALLGEYDDPRLNFAKTATKMSRLIFNDTFLKRVREVGMGEFLFEDGQEPEGHWKKIAGDSSEVYAPLNGLKTTPEIHQAFIDALGREQMAGWFKMVVQANGMVKFGKTVLSPTTAARNWMSAMFFALGNGHFDLTQSRKSWQVVKAYFFQHPGSEMDYLRKLKQLGVVYDTPYAGEMMRLLKDTDIADKLLAGKLSEGLKARHALNLVQKFYQYGDDFWKIIGFENEVALQMKHRNLPREEAETIAAERIRNSYPTYSMVGRGVNQLRRFPLAGTFVSFPAEIVRTSFNMLKYAKEDMQHSPTLGAQRLAGLAMVSGLAYAAQALSKMLLGVDDDEEEAVREQLPHWSKNSNIYFLSREGGKLRYVDLSFLDPYNYWKRPITAIMRDEPFKEKALSAANDMLSPFFGTDILAGALGEIWMNKKSSGGRVYNEADTGWEQTGSMANHLRKAAQPGAFSNAERILKAAKGERTITGREYSLDDELAALAGFRISTLDPAISLKYRTYEAQDVLRNASAILSREARNPNEVEEADLRDTFGRVQSIRKETYGDLLKSIKAARKSGVSHAVIVRQLKAGGMSKRDAFLLSQGRQPTWRPSVTYMRDAIRSAGDTFGKDTQSQLELRRRNIVRWSRERS